MISCFFQHQTVETHIKIHIKNNPPTLNYDGKVIANGYLEVIALTKELIPREVIETRIFIIRGQKVMIDRDLAELYAVRTMALNQAVKRNLRRFPADFMFQLSNKEFVDLKFHFGTSSWGGTRKLPLAFTEQGVAMLSSVLNSERAVQVNIQIMRTFTRLRQLLSSHAELKRKIEEMEKKYDGQFKVVFDAINELMEIPDKTVKNIGFLGHGK
jgi:ORF6N domain